MTGGRTPEERLVLGLSGEPDEPGGADVDRARRTVEALERLRAQLLHTQGVLDDYLGQLDASTDETRSTPAGNT